LLLQMKWILPILIVLAVAAPNSKDLAIIVGGKIAIDVARSEPVSEAATKALELLRAKIDAELRGTKKRATE
jgi:urea transporter